MGWDLSVSLWVVFLICICPDLCHYHFGISLIVALFYVNVVDLLLCFLIYFIVLCGSFLDINVHMSYICINLFKLIFLRWFSFACCSEGFPHYVSWKNGKKYSIYFLFSFIFLCLEVWFPCCIIIFISVNFLFLEFLNFGLLFTVIYPRFNNYIIFL